jgi:hypothetical protein
VALRAIVAEIVLDVIRAADAGKVSRVAIVTSRRRVDITLRMAGNTLEPIMRPGKRKSGRAVVKCRWRPRVGIVAGRAIVIKVVLSVIRTCCRGKVS